MARSNLKSSRLRAVHPEFLQNGYGHGPPEA